MSSVKARLIFIIPVILLFPFVLIGLIAGLIWTGIFMGWTMIEIVTQDFVDWTQDQ